MLEVSIVDYRPSFYGQVYHMLRDSINEEWRREYTRSVLQFGAPIWGSFTCLWATQNFTPVAGQLGSKWTPIKEIKLASRRRRTTTTYVHSMTCYHFSTLLPLHSAGRTRPEPDFDAATWPLPPLLPPPRPTTTRREGCRWWSWSPCPASSSWWSRCWPRSSGWTTGSGSCGERASRGL